MISPTRQFLQVDLSDGNTSLRCSHRKTAQDLIELWQIGDESAATQLYERFVDTVRKVVVYHLNRRFQSRVDVEDVVQRVFLEVFHSCERGIEPFADDRCFEKWIRTVARNRTIKMVKFESAARRGVHCESRATTPEAFQIMVDARARSTAGANVVASSDLRESVNRLDAEAREIVSMLEHRCTQHEIASRLNCTKRTVRRRIQRIRTMLDDAA